MNQSNKPVFPRRSGGFMFVAALLAAGAGYGALEYWGRAHQIERFYLGSYVSSGVMPGKTRREYTVLLPDGSQRKISATARAFHDFLVDSVYGQKQITSIIPVPIAVFAVVLVAGMFVGVLLERRQNERAREGRLIEGPVEMTRAAFNRKVGGDGIGIESFTPRTVREWLKGDEGRFLRIRREDEAKHTLIAGAQGTGKSTIMHGMLNQIAARREIAVVLDPAQEYLKAHYNAERGDIILNPLDDRTPYWALEEEAESESDGIAMATAVWPDVPNEQPFFRKHPRNIVGYLLNRYNWKNAPDLPATCYNLGRWCANPRVEITPRIAGTEHAISTDSDAKDQSAGLWATIGEIARPLRMMPRSFEKRQKFTIKQWTRSPQGWIFITSTPKTLDALRPVQTLWLDMLTMGLQEHGAGNGQKVWMMLDEISSLNQMPQLEAALTRQRKSGNPIVLGMQSMSQINDLYGKEKAKTILGQAKTIISLGMREPDGSEHQANLVGKRKVERITETRPMGGLRGRSFSTQVADEYATQPSVFQGLEDLQGFVQQTGKFVRITLRPANRLDRAQGFIAREIEPETFPVSPKAAAIAEEAVIAVEAAAEKKGARKSGKRKVKPEYVVVEGEIRQQALWRDEEILEVAE